MKNNKFILGLILGIVLAAAFSILAWQDPDQDPPQGKGALYVSGNNIIIDKNMRVDSGRLKIGKDSNPSGIEMFDIVSDTIKCLRISSGAILISDGECP